MANWAGYAALKGQSRRLRWPETHKNDLTKYDRAVLAKKDAPQMFDWSIRQTGPDFYFPNSLPSIHWAQAMKKSGCRTQRYYWYDGKNLLGLHLMN